MTNGEPMMGAKVSELESRCRSLARELRRGGNDAAARQIEHLAAAFNAHDAVVVEMEREVSRLRALSAQQPEAVAGDPTNPDGTERLCRLLYHRRPEPRDYIGSDCRMLHHAATLIERYQRITADRAEEFSEWWERHGQFSRAGGGEYEKTFAYNAWNAALNPGFGEPAP